MKKIFYGFIVGSLIIISLTGCGNQSLKCNMEDGNEKSEVVVSFKNKEATKIIMKSIGEVDSEENAKQSVDIINNLSSKSEKNGIVMSAKADGKKVSMEMTMDISKMSNNDLKKQFNTENLSKENLTKLFEDKGYSCK